MTASFNIILSLLLSLHLFSHPEKNKSKDVLGESTPKNIIQVILQSNLFTQNHTHTFDQASVESVLQE